MTCVIGIHFVELTFMRDFADFLRVVSHVIFDIEFLSSVFPAAFPESRECVNTRLNLMETQSWTLTRTRCSCIHLLVHIARREE